MDPVSPKDKNIGSRTPESDASGSLNDRSVCNMSSKVREANAALRENNRKLRFSTGVVLALIVTLFVCLTLFPLAPALFGFLAGLSYLGALDFSVHSLYYYFNVDRLENRLDDAKNSFANA